MNPKVGTGPFAVANEPALITDDLKAVQVVDQIGKPFCYIAPLHCHGQDWSAATARARCIAEALNRNDALRGALVKAREIIQSERDTTVECATMPPGHDIAPLDAETKPFVEELDTALTEIAEALR